MGQRWAIRLGAALLAALVLVAALAVHDNTRRGGLEHAAEVTAVGDAVFFRPNPSSDQSRAPAAIMNGQPLFPVSAKTVGIRDTDVARVGKDSSTGVSIYEARPDVRDKSKSDGKPAERFYLLKVAPGDFIKVRP